MSIINATGDTSINYFGASYAITNNAGAELNLNNITVDAYNGINNSGSLTLDKSSILAAETAIKNTGTTIAQNNIAINGASYPIYNDGGESTISDATITGAFIYNNSGNLALSNSASSKEGSYSDYVVNKGHLSMSNVNISSTITYFTQMSWGGSSRVFYNNGTAILNNTTMSHAFNSPSEDARGTMHAIYNDSGSSIIATNLNLTANGLNVKSASSIYAVYSPKASFTIESGIIHSIHKNTAYGIYTETGTITIGVQEPSDSPNYGRDTANVSRTNPEISAIDTKASGTRTGIGVKNASGGRVEYYDGKVSGNTAAFAEEPTVTEHFYEPCTELDTSVTPNLYTTHLFWMRDGQSSCANN